MIKPPEQYQAMNKGRFLRKIWRIRIICDTYKPEPAALEAAYQQMLSESRQQWIDERYDPKVWLDRIERADHQRDCWYWMNRLTKNDSGYPIFVGYDIKTGKTISIYGRQFAWELVYNTVLTPHVECIASFDCENPNCVSPFHGKRTTRADIQQNKSDLVLKLHKARQLVAQQGKQAASDHGVLHAEIEANRRK